MRIGIDARVLSKPGSGIVRYSKELLKELIENHPEHQYYLYTHPADKLTLRPFKNGRYVVTQINLPKLLWRTKLFTDLISKDNIDVLYCTNPIAPYVPANKRKMAVVTTSHGLMPKEYWSSLKDRLYWLPNQPLAFKYADRIICVSQDTKFAINAAYGKPISQMDVTYFGINSNMKPLNKKGKAKAMAYLCKKYTIPNRDFILYVGGSAPNKNVPTVLKTWKVLKEKYNFKLPIIIARVDYNSIDRQLEALNLNSWIDVVAIPWIEFSDVPLFYACAKINLYATLYEGVGFVIPEAQSCGSPVINSNLQCLEEAAGGCTRLVDNPTSPDCWAEAIFYLYHGDARTKRLIKLGLQNAKRFTWKNTAEATLECFKKAIEDKQGN